MKKNLARRNLRIGSKNVKITFKTNFQDINPIDESTPKEDNKLDEIM